MVEQRCCLTLLVLSCLLLTLAEAGTVCPSGWSAFGSGCYKLIDDLRSWTEAKALCRSYNGSHMVVSNDKVESAFILDRLLGGSSDRIWLGGTYKSGKWEMEDLSSFTPSSLSGLAGDCLTMTKTDTKRTTCTDFNKFVCELEAPFCQNNQYPFDSSCYEVVSNPATASDYCKQRGGDLVVISNSDESTFVDKVKASESSVNPVCEVPRGQCRSGWQAFGWMCYKAFSTATSWTNAQDSCKKEGGQLAVVNSAKILQLVKHTVDTNLNFFIGGQDQNLDGMFQWLDFTDIPFTGYDFISWFPNSPSEKCLSLLFYDYQSHDSYTNPLLMPVACQADAVTTSANRFGSFVCQYDNTPYEDLKYCPTATKCHHFGSVSTYDDALYECRKKSLDLVSVVTEDALQSALTAASNYLTADYVMMGLKLDINEESCKWTWRFPHGFPLNDKLRSQMWKSGEPEYCSQSDTKRYTTLFNSARSTNFLKSTAWSSSNSYMCESTPCGSGWYYYGGSCYLFGPDSLKKKVSWTDAQGDCSARGSNLVIISSSDELNFIGSYLQTSGTNEFAQVYTGLYFDNALQKWLYVNGRTSLPDIIRPDKDVGNTSVVQKDFSGAVVLKSARDDDFVQLSRPTPYVCEKPIAFCLLPTASEGVIMRGLAGALPGAESELRFECDTGYLLISGDPRIICGSNGQWIGTVPTCEKMQCGQPEVGQYGQVLGTSYTFGDTVKYECDRGYEITIGNAVRTCQADGSWSGIKPVCDVLVCSDPGQVANVRRDLSGTVYGSDVIYTCNDYYLLGSGNLRRTCEANKQWSGVPPVCIPATCTVPSTFGEGVAQGTITNYGSYAIYKCPSGYDLDEGGSTRRCLDGIRLDGKDPKCKRSLPCPGSLISQGFSCYTSTKLLLPKTGKRGIDTNAYIQAALSTCQKINAYPASISTADDKAFVQNVISLSKMTGSLLFIGLSFSSSTFSWLDGSSYFWSDWSAAAPSYPNMGDTECVVANVSNSLKWKVIPCADNLPLICEQRKKTECSLPASVASATFNYTTLEAGGVLTYSCQNDYEIASGDSVQTCNALGQWNGVAPTCQQIRCPSPPVVKNSTWMGSTNLTVGTTISYICQAGFLMTSGDAMLTCLKTKAWSGVVPKCQPVACPDPGFVVNSDRIGTDFTYDQVVEFRCTPGYNIFSGDAKWTCMADGRWHGVKPVCKTLPCENDPGSIQYGERLTSPKSVYSYNDQVIYQCIAGYASYKGNLTRSCLGANTWSGTQPECELIKCPVISIPNTERFGDDDYRWKKTVSYTCLYGFNKISGDLTRTCQIDGTWSGSPIECQGAKCPEPEAGTNARIVAKGARFTEKLVYECNMGYEATSGNLERQCLVDGRWSGEAPICQVLTCYTPESVNNGVADYPKPPKYGSKAKYSCSTGSLLANGDTERTCTASRTWSGSPPECQPVACPPLARPDECDIFVGDLVYNSTALYKCHYGYGPVSGDTSRTCQANSVWSGVEPVCTLIICPAPDTAFNGTVRWNGGVGFGDTVVYECPSGSEVIAGDSVRVCSSERKWSGVTPTCGKRIKTCPFPENSDNTIWNAQSLLPGSVLTYKCLVGYIQDSGDANRICLNDETWSGELLVCEAIDCGTPPPVNGTIVRGSDYTFGKIVFYSCLVGYHERGGSSTKRCSDSGAWTGEDLQCKSALKPEAAVDAVTARYSSQISTSKAMGTVAIALLSCIIGFVILLDIDCKKIRKYYIKWKKSQPKRKRKVDVRDVYGPRRIHSGRVTPDPSEFAIRITTGSVASNYRHDYENSPRGASQFSTNSAVQSSRWTPSLQGIQEQSNRTGSPAPSQSRPQTARAQTPRAQTPRAQTARAQSARAQTPRAQTPRTQTPRPPTPRAQTPDSYVPYQSGDRDTSPLDTYEEGAYGSSYQGSDPPLILPEIVMPTDKKSIANILLSKHDVKTTKRRAEKDQRKIYNS